MNALSEYFGDESVMTSRRGLTWQSGAAIGLLTIIYIPILSSMVQHWRIVPDYSHGFLIVPLALIFAYEKKFHLKAVPI